MDKSSGINAKNIICDLKPQELSERYVFSKLRIRNIALAKNMLSKGITIGLSMLAGTALANDLDIYQKEGASIANSSASPIITMMLDLSGSMGESSIADDNNYNCGKFTDSNVSVTVALETISVPIRYCSENNETGSTVYDLTRVDRLRLGLISLLADSIKMPTGFSKVETSDVLIQKDIYIALGAYPFASTREYLANGRIVHKAVKLTPENRVSLIKTIASLEAKGGTPMAAGLAEAGAYMLGASNKTPMTSYTVLGIKSLRSGSQIYRTCTQLSSNPGTRILQGESIYFQGCFRYSGLTNQANASSGSDLTVTGTEAAQLVPTSVNSDRTLEVYLKKGTAEVVSPFSGMRLSVADSKTTAGDKYIAGIDALGSTEESCGAKSENGIYILTDGVPNTIGKRSSYEIDMKDLSNFMNISLKDQTKSGKVSSQCDSANGIDDIEHINPSNVNEGYGGWPCMGEYAKLLNNPNLNNGRVKVATVGFGNIFKAFKDQSTCEIDDSIIVDAKSSLDLMYKKSARNLCRLGSKDFGGGGFTYVESISDISDSILDFANSFVAIGDYAPQPSDSPSVSVDITDVTRTSEFAYLPMFQPFPAEPKLAWPGNLKKYRLKNGSLFDSNDNHIFTGVNGSIDNDGDDKAKDFWNSTTVADGAAIREAGVYAQLRAPVVGSITSTRNVFVETANNTGSQTLLRIGVGEGGAVENLSTVALGYDRQRLHYLMNYLGFDVPVFNASGAPISDADYPATGATMGADPLSNATTYAPETPVKVLGSIHNSKPQEILFKQVQTFDTNDNVSTSDTKRVLFGSMDGALHLVNSGKEAGKGGKEVFAFIPNAVIKSPYVAALKEGSTQLPDGTTNAVGNVAFGVDAPWLVRPRYCRVVTASSITIQASNCPQDDGSFFPGFMKVYGGLGRGGIGFYGLDITDDNVGDASDLSLAKNKPSIMFKIDNSTTGFADIGHTWSKPVAAKVKNGVDKHGKDIIRDVLFVSGGYDLCYDFAEFDVSSTKESLIKEIKSAGKAADCLNADSTATKSSAKGNAIYMIDADTGSLLWSTQSEASSVNVNLKHSIPGEVSVLDYDMNGYVDAIYFADLGGQLFRSDFDDAKNGGTSGWGLRTIRLLNTDSIGSNSEKVSTPLRFYQAPVISPYYLTATGQGLQQVVKSVKNGGRLQFVISIASGDRNNPLAKLSERVASKNPDKVISVWDREVLSNKTLTSETLIFKDKNLANLVELDRNVAEMSTNDKNALYNDLKFGWYENLKFFSGSNSSISSSGGQVIKPVAPGITALGTSVDYLKAIGQPTVRVGQLYIPVFNQLAYIPAKSKCQPAPTGITEAQTYCLPFGYCAIGNDGDKNSVAGRGRTAILGAGIASPAIGSIGDGTSKATLITTEVIPVIQKDPDNENKPGAGGGGKNGLERQRTISRGMYQLLPGKWYERMPKPIVKPVLSGNAGSGTP